MQRTPYASRTNMPYTAQPMHCNEEVTCSTAAHLLILQTKVLSNLHALEPADVASGIGSLVKGGPQAFALVQGHHMKGAPGAPGQNVGHCGGRKPGRGLPGFAGGPLVGLAACAPTHEAKKLLCFWRLQQGTPVTKCYSDENTYWCMMDEPDRHPVIVATAECPEHWQKLSLV